MAEAHRRRRRVEARARQMNVRLGQDEYAAIVTAATEAGLTVSGYVAEVATSTARGGDPTRRGERRSLLAGLDAVAVQVSKVGANVNQIARHLNSDPDAVAPIDSIGRLAARVTGALDELDVLRIELSRRTRS